MSEFDFEVPERWETAQPNKWPGRSLRVLCPDGRERCWKCGHDQLIPKTPEAVVWGAILLFPIGLVLLLMPKPLMCLRCRTRHHPQGNTLLANELPKPT